MLNPNTGFTVSIKIIELHFNKGHDEFILISRLVSIYVRLEKELNKKLERED